jgi:hypothetical protein
MKNYEKLLLVLFGINCLTTIFLDNWAAVLGWGCAFMVQLRVMKYINIDE